MDLSYQPEIAKRIYRGGEIMRTNKEVIEMNIKTYQSAVDRKKGMKLNPVELRRYKEEVRLLEREKEKLRELILLGEEYYSKIHPYR